MKSLAYIVKRIVPQEKWQKGLTLVKSDTGKLQNNWDTIDNEILIYVQTIFFIWLLSDTPDKYKHNSLKVDLVKFNLSTIIPPYSHTDP